MSGGRGGFWDLFLNILVLRLVVCLFCGLGPFKIVGPKRQKSKQVSGGGVWCAELVWVGETGSVVGYLN